MVAALVLLLVYVGLSFFNDTHGYLGTDTGAKVATLKVMSRDGTIVPDVGYWAARWDPQTRVPGLYQTVHMGEHYVVVTSLPMIVVGYPLWDLGGYRAALLLPMLGSLAAAFAARALARRLGAHSAAGPTDGWAAFWIIGLASPLTIYALDFWEHSIGVALMVWGMVALYDAIDVEPTAWRGLLAGVAFGAAASMRTEALVYAFGGTAVACLAIAFGRRRSLLAACKVGASAVAGVAALFAANLLLEESILGQQMRSSRVASASSKGLLDLGLRAKEGLTTLVSPFPAVETTAWLLGLLLLVAIGYGSIRATEAGGQRVAAILGGLAVAIYLLRFADGLGFVPGLVAATPFAAVGIALGWKVVAQRIVLLFALVPIPLEVGFHFVGGAAPQWAGRYLLTSGLLLAVVGIVESRRMVSWARTGVVVLSVAVTFFGLAWLSVRSHQIADAADRLETRSEQVLVSPNGFVPREFGATYGRKRWLSSDNPKDLRLAASIVRKSGATSFGLVDLDTRRRAPRFAGWRPVHSDLVQFLSGTDFRVTTYERSAG